MLTRIAVNQPVYTNKNPSASEAISEGVNPVSIDFGHFHAHEWIVSHGIRKQQAQAQMGFAVERWMSASAVGDPME